MDPGHMGVYWSDAGRLFFRGYYPVFTSLPKFDTDEEMRTFFFTHRVPGEITNDVILERMYKEKKLFLLGRNWNLDEERQDDFVASVRPQVRGYYSFAPDKFSCDNCVTWSVSTINSQIPHALPIIANGRIKKMAEELEK